MSGWRPSCPTSLWLFGIMIVGLDETATGKDVLFDVNDGGHVVVATRFNSGRVIG